MVANQLSDCNRIWSLIAYYDSTQMEPIAVNVWIIEFMAMIWIQCDVVRGRGESCISVPCGRLVVDQILISIDFVISSVPLFRDGQFQCIGVGCHLVVIWSLRWLTASDMPHSESGLVKWLKFCGFNIVVSVSNNVSLQSVSILSISVVCEAVHEVLLCLSHQLFWLSWSADHVNNVPSFVCHFCNQTLTVC